MSKIFRFREFPVYKDTRIFRKELKKFSKEKFPKSEEYCLRPQLWRALDSIILDIAEGSEKYSDLDFSRFLNMAQTSLNEVVGCLDLAIDDDYITKTEYEHFYTKADIIYRQLRAFSKKVRPKSNRKQWYSFLFLSSYVHRFISS